MHARLIKRNIQQHGSDGTRRGGDKRRGQRTATRRGTPNRNTRHGLSFSPTVQSLLTPGHWLIHTHTHTLTPFVPSLSLLPPLALLFPPLFARQLHLAVGQYRPPSAPSCVAVSPFTSLTCTPRDNACWSAALPSPSDHPSTLSTDTHSKAPQSQNSRQRRLHSSRLTTANQVSTTLHHQHHLLQPPCPHSSREKATDLKTLPT